MFCNLLALRYTFLIFDFILYIVFVVVVCFLTGRWAYKQGELGGGGGDYKGTAGDLQTVYL